MVDRTAEHPAPGTTLSGIAAFEPNPQPGAVFPP